MSDGKSKWIKKPNTESAMKPEEKSGHEHESGHHRKQAIRDEKDHTKPKKSAEGLKKTFYGHKGEK